MADYQTNNQTKENLLNDLKNKFKVIFYCKIQKKKQIKIVENNQRNSINLKNPNEPQSSSNENQIDSNEDELLRLKDELTRKTVEFRQTESRLIYELDENKKLIDSLNLKIKDKDRIINVINIQVFYQFSLHLNLKIGFK